MRQAGWAVHAVEGSVARKYAKKLVEAGPFLAASAGQDTDLAKVAINAVAAVVFGA